jgi:hypothetical protein
VLVYALVSLDSVDGSYVCTGVDPSGIGFDWSRLMTGLVHVSHEDARFVHLYHSNSAIFGTTLRLGMADYMFNNGESQPGCNSFGEEIPSLSLSLTAIIKPNQENIKGD